MNYFYINLDGEQTRAQQVEQQFAACSPQRLQRFSALDRQWIAQHQVAGRIREVEKACYMSHLSLLKRQQTTQTPFCIFEDDVSFFPETEQIIQAAMAAASSTSWDVLFTNVCIPDPHVMIDMFLLHRQLQASQGLQLLPLHNINFAAAAGYVVNPASVQKLITLLDTPTLDLPYDLALREYVHNGQLNAFTIFPFATGLSAHTNHSQIQEGSNITDLAWNTLRNLLGWQIDTQQAHADLDTVPEAHVDEATRALSRVLAITLAKNFQAK